MKWIRIDEKKPNLNEAVILAINYHKGSQLAFWKKKLITSGWLVQIKQTNHGARYLFYDQNHQRYWCRSVSHWTSLSLPSD